MTTSSTDTQPNVTADVLKRCREVRLISFDVDGVLTDGLLYYCDDGREIKAFNVQDGAALKLLQEHGIAIAILTGRSSPMVTRRAEELGIRHVYQGLADKRVALDAICAELALEPREIAHVGDDLPDIAIFDAVGLAISVPNGHPGARARADHVTATHGGHGVAREVCELVLRAQSRWPYD